MAKHMNGAGFRLYFPEAEEDATDTLPQASPPSSQPVTSSKGTADAYEKASDNREDASDGKTPGLSMPCWQNDWTVRKQTTSRETTAEVDKQAPTKHRTSLSIPPVDAGAIEPNQEPNLKSHVDSRRRSSQLAEGP
jgi:hypothetical protein